MTGTLSANFFKLYRQMFWGIDVCRKDDPYDNSITSHGVVDADAQKFETDKPTICEAATKYLVDKKMDLKGVHEEFNLVGIPDVLLAELKDAKIPSVRKDMLRREIGFARIQLHYLFAEVIGAQKPTFQELWKAVRGTGYPRLAQFSGEVTSIKQTLMFLLSQAGTRVNDPRELRAALQQWKASQKNYGIENEAEIIKIAKSSLSQMFLRFKAVAKDIAGLAPYLDRLDPAKLVIKMVKEMSFDAGLSYIGGIKDGNPTLEGLFEWNGSRPAIKDDICYIADHEGTHALSAMLQDLQRRAGLLGPESALLLMAAPRTILEEGLAQVLPEILYGGVPGVAENLGVGAAIELVLDQLQDIARIAASVGENVEFADRSPEQREQQIFQYVTNYLLQSDHIGKKMCKTYWRQDPVGITYTSAYYYGSRALRRATEQYSAQKVLTIATHTRGLCDIQAFNTLVREA